MALTVFKTVRDLTTSGWVGSIPMHSRHSVDRAARSNTICMYASTCLRAARTLGFALVLFACAGWNSLSAQQRPDSTARPIPTVPPPTSALRPPVTPRRAFLYSFLLPGSGQAVLGRHKAAVTFMLVEAISLSMIRESASDVQEARRTENDSVVVRYVDDAGNPLFPPDLSPPKFDDDYVRARRAHVEDWIALLVANHLFAGADAFVAAHLWDVPARLGLRILPRSGGAAVTARFKW